jgi:hypothetical protein
MAVATGSVGQHTKPIENMPNGLIIAQRWMLRIMSIVSMTLPHHNGISLASGMASEIWIEGIGCINQRDDILLNKIGVTSGMTTSIQSLRARISIEITPGKLGLVLKATELIIPTNPIGTTASYYVSNTSSTWRSRWMLSILYQGT